jgi:hypothetical protein
MNLTFTTLVTDEPPRVKLESALGQIPTGTFDVQLPNSMTPEAKAAWCLGFAGQLTDLAARIQAATVPA